MKKPQNQIETILIVLILLIAGVMRFYNYAGFSMSNDELSAIARLRFNNFSELISQGVKIDGHPAGVQVLLYYWSKLFGIWESAIRFPFVLFGIASVYLIYLVGKHWFNAATGLFAASTLCVLQFPILYSQIARPYSPGLFFVLLATYFWTKIIAASSSPLLWRGVRGQADGRVYCGFIFSVSASMYSHYLSFLQVGIICLAGLFFLRKENYKAYIISGIVILILYIPHYNIFKYQMSIGGIGGEAGWLGKPSGDFWWEYLQYAFNSRWLLFLFIVFFVFSIVVFKIEKSKNKFRVLTLLFFLIPYLVAFFYSIYKNPVLQNSTLLFSSPFLILFLFSFVPESLSMRNNLTGVFSILAIGIFSTVYSEKYYSTQHFAVFRQLAEKTIEYDETFGSKNITRTYNIHNPYYINYYFEKFSHPATAEHYICHEYPELVNMIKAVHSSDKKYFLHAWSNIYDLPEIDDIIKSKFPFVIGKTDYFNSGITLYSKDSSVIRISKKNIFEFTHDFEIARWDNDSSYLSDSLAHSGKKSIFIFAETEFSPGYLMNAGQATIRKNDVIHVSFWFFFTQDKHQCKLVLSIDDQEKNIEWQGREFKFFQTNNSGWQQIFLTYKVKGDLLPDEKIKIYVWNDKKENIYLDDFNFRITRNF